MSELPRSTKSELLAMRNQINKSSGLDIGYVPAGPHAFFRSSGQFGPQQLILWWPAGPVAFRWVENVYTSFFVDVSHAAVRWFDLQVFSSTELFYLHVRTSIKTWLTNTIRHVTKLLMPKLQLIDRFCAVSNFPIIAQQRELVAPPCEHTDHYFQ